DQVPLRSAGVRIDVTPSNDRQGPTENTVVKLHCFRGGARKEEVCVDLHRYLLSAEPASGRAPDRFQISTGPYSTRQGADQSRTLLAWRRVLRAKTGAGTSASTGRSSPRRSTPS